MSTFHARLWLAISRPRQPSEPRWGQVLGDDKRDRITYFDAGRFDAMWFDAQYFQEGKIVRGVMIPVKGWHPVP